MLHWSLNYSDDQIAVVDLLSNESQGEGAVLLTDTQREFTQSQREITDQ